VLVVKDGESLYGMEAICAHMGCAILSEVKGRVAICPAHGAKYDIVTGNMIEKPIVRPEEPCELENISLPLRIYRVSVDKDGFLNIE